MAETLFGLIGSLDPTILLAVFIGLIFLLIIFETALHLLEEYAIDSGYEDLVRRLYKEMMMMGYLSFGVFLAFNAAGLKHDQQYLAFEFSHITTFFIAIFFVVRACLFVKYTRTSKQYFQSADTESIASLVKRYKDLHSNSWTLEALIYNLFPNFSSLRRCIEFHILKDFFFKTYRLIPSEFRYVNYLSKNYKFYVIELTEIRPLCWFVPIALILLNYLRVQVVGDVGIGISCDSSHHYFNSSYYDDDHHRFLASGGDDVSYHVSHTCEEYLIPYALFCSGLLVLFACLVAALTIRSKNKLLTLAGVKSEDDILIILQRLLVQEQYLERQQELESPQSLPIKSNGSLLKNDVKGLDESSHKMSRQSSLFSFNTVPQEEYQVCTLRVMLHIHQEEQEMKAHEWLHTLHHYIRVLSEIFSRCNYKSNGQTKMSPMIERVKSLKLKAQLEQSNTVESDSDVEVESKPEDDMGDIEMQITVPSSHPHLHHAHDDDFLDPKSHPLAQEIHSVFPFSSKELYEFLIQEMLLLDSLFLALWATNFITMSLHSKHQVSYNLIFLIPIFLMTLLNFVIMFLSSTLFALTSLKNKGAEWICEQADICQKVLPHLRREILTILPNGANDKRLVELYLLISGTNSSGKIDPENPPTSEGIQREGFAQLLHILDMHPSEKEIRALFRSMDKDDSGSIELSELKLLLLDPNIAETKSPNTKHKKSLIDI